MCGSRDFRMLVVILGHITGLGVEITNLKEDAVFLGDLLFESRGEIQLFEIIVGPEPIFAPIKGIDREAAIVKNTINRAALLPIAVTGIIGAGEDAQAIRSKQPRVFLL